MKQPVTVLQKCGSIPSGLIGFVFAVLLVSGCVHYDGSDNGDSPLEGFCSTWNEGDTNVAYSESSYANNTSMEAGVSVHADSNGGITVRVVGHAREAYAAERVLTVREPGVTLDSDERLVRVTVESHETDAVMQQPHQPRLDVLPEERLAPGSYELEVCVEQTRSMNMEYVRHDIHSTTFHID